MTKLSAIGFAKECLSVKKAEQELVRETHIRFTIGIAQNRRLVQK